MRRRSSLLALVGLTAAVGCGTGKHPDAATGGPHVVAMGTPTSVVAPSEAMHRPHPMRHPRPRVRNGHLVRNFLLDHGDPLHDPPDGNTPFGNFWWIGASSTQTSAIPNSGVQMETMVVTTPAAAAGGCFSVWTSDVLDNDMWGQIGFSACDDEGEPFYDLTSFFQVWNLAVGSDGELLIDQESDDITVGLHTFSMYVQSGTTWAYAVDGNVMGIADMGSATASAPSGVQTLSEEGDGVAAAFVPPSVPLPVAMEVRSGTTWGPATTAIIVNTAGLGGVVGNLQDSTLADDQIVIGGDSPTLSQDIPLWNGTVTDGGLSTESDAAALSEPYVAVACPAANTTIGGKVTIQIAATSPNSIASVRVSADGANDEDGGSEANLCNLTTAPYVCEWDTTSQSEGQYFLYVVAIDGQGFATYDDLLVTVSHAASSPCSTSPDGGSVGQDAGPPTDGGGHDGGLVVDGGGSGTDSGGPGNPLLDGAVDDAAAGAPASGGHSSNGCSCRAIGDKTDTSSAPGPIAAFAALGILVFVRRRRFRAMSNGLMGLFPIVHFAHRNHGRRAP
jgi:hypothetical protein